MKTVALLICISFVMSACVPQQALRAEPPETYERAPNGAM